MVMATIYHETRIPDFSRESYPSKKRESYPFYFLLSQLAQVKVIWSLTNTKPDVLCCCKIWLQEVAPLTSGRLSHSSGPLTGGGSLTDSPPVSPEIDDSQVRFFVTFALVVPVPRHLFFVLLMYCNYWCSTASSSTLLQLLMLKQVLLLARRLVFVLC
jgi:hypothetical protein